MNISLVTLFFFLFGLFFLPTLYHDIIPFVFFLSFFPSFFCLFFPLQKIIYRDNHDVGKVVVVWCGDGGVSYSI